MVQAFSDHYGSCSNNFAEAKAVLQGCSICYSLGFQNFIVKSDSMLIVNMLNKSCQPHWQIRHIQDQIWEISNSRNVLFVHTFREGKGIADYLANLGVHNKSLTFFNEVVSFPNQVRASLKFDQDGVPNFRFRPKKNYFCINDAIT
ncbi:uncharacterized protein LOC132031870 [Lycium ferocissimum]|uniref:uncharacterized protein LOC132031870 n=1 Tax=Lycium ferocissimum TaxID=112874 RepID=UPI002815E7F7|nr:uncharacterized protein LOC132031870 [Lycium ferocissimum]